MTRAMPCRRFLASPNTSLDAVPTRLGRVSACFLLRRDFMKTADRDALARLKATLTASKTAETPVTAPPPQPDPVDFATQMHGVRRLKPAPVVRLHSTAPRAADASVLARRAAAEGSPINPDVPLSDMRALLHPVGSEAFLSWRVPSLPKRVHDQLRDGKLPWSEAVDLHGCTVEEARDGVLEVIAMARREGQRVVRIVHGKGSDALLKTCVNGWLRQHPDVLGFASAPANQGGNGAVLVLLRRGESPPERRESV